MYSREKSWMQCYSKNTGNLLIITKTHNHSQTEHQTDTIIFANRIKRVAETSTENLREIFNTECCSSSGDLLCHLR